VGTSESFGFDQGKSPLTLQTESFLNALADASLQKSDIDGFATAHGSPRGVDYEQFTVDLGLDCRYIDQAWSHGRWASSIVAHAAFAVIAGLANYVAISNTQVTRRGYGKYFADSRFPEGLRDTGGGHGEWNVHGFDVPGSATSLVAQRYMDRYGATGEDLANVAVGLREYATLNPVAVLRDKPLTREAYFAEALIAGPFRRSDYMVQNEGSTTLIVTTTERARDAAKTPALIAGVQGVRSGRENYVMFSRPGLGVGFSGEFDYDAGVQPVYQMAGVEQSDVDALYLYDSFSSNLWMVLERQGFCAPGEAPAMIAEHGFGPASALPINTNGGLLCEGDQTGYGHLVEMVRQLRGEAGARQVPDAQIVQWASPWGDSMILRRLGRSALPQGRTTARSA
jgi:acetyl-CoA acetyltransferase